jgi:hypothetical protein
MSPFPHLPMSDLPKSVVSPLPLHAYVAGGAKKMKLVSWHLLLDRGDDVLVAGLFQDGSSWTAGTFEHKKGSPPLSRGSFWVLEHDKDGDSFPVARK